MTERYETSLWKQLAEQGLVQGEPPERNDEDAPWYVRTMLGIAGWIGALFMLGALFSGFAMLFDSALAAGVLGVVACLVSMIIYRSLTHNDFMAQFGFAISLAGQGLLVFSMLQGLELFEGGTDFIDRIRQLAIIMVGLQLILFFMIPNYLHRIWSGVMGVSALTFLIIQFGFYPFSLALLLAATALVWLKEFDWAKHSAMVQALGYSLVFVCFMHLVTENHVIGMSRFWQEVFGVTPIGGNFGNNISVLMLGLVLLVVVVVLLKRAGTQLMSSKGIAAWLLALFIALLGIWTPGITVALVFAILGYAHGNRVLTGMGLVTLVIFVSQFYYQLELTLLYKSIVLCVSGLALLLMRKLMKTFWRQQEVSHA